MGAALLQKQICEDIAGFEARIESLKMEIAEATSQLSYARKLWDLIKPVDGDVQIAPVVAIPHGPAIAPEKRDEFNRRRRERRAQKNVQGPEAQPKNA